MENLFGLKPCPEKTQTELGELQGCNRFTAAYGLVLSQTQMQTLLRRRNQALQNTNRVEFGGGILKDLIQAFCDSPFLHQENYEETLLELQDLFYYYKNESMDLWSDEELVGHMRRLYDGPAQGSMEYLGGTGLEQLCRKLRNGEPMEEEKQEDYE